MRFSWRLFPYAVGLWLVAVGCIDGYISMIALRTFPGVVTHNQFNDSNRYDAVLDSAAREASLGWRSEIALTAGAPRLVLADRDGRKLEGARVTGQAIRPLGNTAPHALTFRAVAPGEYLADTVLTEQGQWEIDLIASVAGKQVHVAQRLVVK